MENMEGRREGGREGGREGQADERISAIFVIPLLQRSTPQDLDRHTARQGENAFDQRNGRELLPVDEADALNGLSGEGLVHGVLQGREGGWEGGLEEGMDGASGGRRTYLDEEKVHEGDVVGGQEELLKVDGLRRQVHLDRDPRDEFEGPAGDHADAVHAPTCAEIHMCVRGHACMRQKEVERKTWSYQQ
jgi:hypothetical protein